MTDNLPSCEECGGACCEEVTLQPYHLNLDSDSWRWLELHATKVPENGVRLECKCLALTTEGRCSIYDKRPGVCRDFERGGPDCLDKIARRRPLLWSKMTWYNKALGKDGAKNG